MRPTLCVLVVIAALALGACGSQVETRFGSVGETTADIAAANLAFDRSELQVPAGVTVSLVFENRDTAPHNLAVYLDASASRAVFVGEIFGGPGSRQYTLPALAAGTYHFRCDVHPEMQGTLVATP
jgi:plastocyanin